MDTVAPRITRKGKLGSALALGVRRAHWASARGAQHARGDVTRDLPPLTLGITRVVWRPGAISQSTTQGMHIIAVESRVVAVGMPRNDHSPLNAADLCHFGVTGRPGKTDHGHARQPGSG